MIICAIKLSTPIVVISALNEAADKNIIMINEKFRFSKYAPNYLVMNKIKHSV